MLTRVELGWQAQQLCLTHALTTEHEEIMGLLVGYIDVSWEVRAEPRLSSKTVVSPENTS